MNQEQKKSGASGSDPLLALRGFSKSFGAVEALKDVDFELHGGEVVGLVGDNGAGKSTLIKAIAGVQPADDGEARFDGRPVTLNSPQAATRLGIATIYQDLALCENLDVVANLFLGQEVSNGGPGSSTRPRWSRSRSSCSGSLGVTTIRSVRTEVEQLSGGQRQAVAIARSLLGEPKLVLLDEPTAALGVVQTKQILELIGRLRERGLGVVVISHNLTDVFQVADRVAVLRLGRMAKTSTPSPRASRRSSRRSPGPSSEPRNARPRRHRCDGSSRHDARGNRRARPVRGRAVRAAAAARRARLGPGPGRDRGDLDDLPALQRPLPLRGQPLQPGASDRGRGDDLDRGRAGAAAGRDRPLGRRGQRPRRLGDGGAERQGGALTGAGDPRGPAGGHRDRRSSTASWSPSSASPPSSSPSPACSAGRGCSSPCSATPARSTCRRARSPTSPGPSSTPRSAGRSRSRRSPPTAPAW